MGSDSENENQTKSKNTDLDKNMDHESGQEKKLPYPKSVFFIVTNEFCERFSYYGMKAVLTLYLKNILKFSDDSATVIYHVFSMCCYFTPVFGAMLADSLLGKFRTIFYLSIIYAAGNIVLALAATGPINLPATPFSLIGLGLIAIGTGGIKPCVAAFGGDQFVLPQQAAQLAMFFSFFYMAINSGSLISTAITPILRNDVTCFDEDSCYSLAFGLPAVLMVVSLLIFLMGKALYRIAEPQGNVVLKVCKCIGHAISRKRKNKGSRDHWLDHADDEYETRFIEDVKILLRVLVLYLPLPVFWSLFDQQGSRWTLQATRMDGVTFGYTIKPDQVQVLNPALILIFIPLFDKLVYPMFAKCNLLKRPLQRLTIGGILAGVAFIISGILELELEKTYPNRLELSESNLNFINGVNCPLTIRLNGRDPAILEKFEDFAFETLPAGDYEFVYSNSEEVPENRVHYFFADGCDGIIEDSLGGMMINTEKSEQELEEFEDGEASKVGGGWTYLVSPLTNGTLQLVHTEFSDDRLKPEEGNPKLKFLATGWLFSADCDEGADSPVLSSKFVISDEKKDNVYEFTVNRTQYEEIGDEIRNSLITGTEEVEPKEYELSWKYKDQDIALGKIELKLGASYAVSIVADHILPAGGCVIVPTELQNQLNVTIHTITEPSTLHMVLLLPQYIVLTAAEIMFSITGLEFSYSQSPVSMKSVLQSCWLLTVAFGNLIDIIIVEAKFFEEQSKEFFLFAGLMFVDMLWFIYMAWRYVPAKLEDPEETRKNKAIADAAAASAPDNDSDNDK